MQGVGVGYVAEHQKIVLMEAMAGGKL
jgi:hypothetical protein